MIFSLWAAGNRAENAANFVTSHPRSVAADIKQISSLIKQAKANTRLAIAEKSLNQTKAQQLSAMFTSMEEKGEITAEKQALILLSNTLNKMVAVIEK